MCEWFLYVAAVVLTGISLTDLIKFSVSPLPCWPPWEIWANFNRTPLTRCHLIGCLLSHNRCLSRSLSKARSGSVTEITDSISEVSQLIISEEIVHLSLQYCVAQGRPAGPKEASSNLTASSIYNTKKVQKKVFSVCFVLA